MITIKLSLFVHHFLPSPQTALDGAVSLRKRLQDYIHKFRFMSLFFITSRWLLQFAAAGCSIGIHLMHAGRSPIASRN